MPFVHGMRVAAPNGFKLSDAGAWRGGCAGEAGGAAAVTRGAVRCSACRPRFVHEPRNA